jgi:hypothetical protein
VDPDAPTEGDDEGERETRGGIVRTDLTARAGDRLVIHPHRLGAPGRDAEILEALGPDGTPPFRVRWSDTGNVTLHFPGDDASVDHLTERRHARTRETSPVA